MPHITLGVNRFEAYNLDTGDSLKGTASIQLVSRELMAHSIKASGLGGELNVAAQNVMSQLVLTLAVAKIDNGHLSIMRLGRPVTLDLRSWNTSVDEDTSARSHRKERWIVRGNVRKTDPGKLENAAAGDGSIEIDVWGYEQTIDGNVVDKWDPIKNIHVTNGDDMYEDARGFLFPNG